MSSVDRIRDVGKMESPFRAAFETLCQPLPGEFCMIGLDFMGY